MDLIIFSCPPHKWTTLEIVVSVSVSVSQYWNHMRAMFGPYKGHVLTIFTMSWLLDDRTGSNFHWRVM